MSPDPRPRQFHPGGALTVLLAVLLGCFVPIGLGWAAVQFPMLDVLEAVEATPPEDIESGIDALVARIEAVELRIGLVALLRIGAMLVTAGVFIAWYRRMYRNLLWFGAARLGETLAWASWCWIVPIANLIVPYGVLRETWRGSDPEVDLEASRTWKVGPAPPVMVAWWTCWVGVGILGSIATFARLATEGEIDRARLQARLCIVDGVLLAVAAVLAILAIRDIDRRQRTKATALERALRERARAEAEGEEGMPAP